MEKFDTEDARELHQQRQAMYEAVDKYRKSFIDESTGMIHRKYTESRQCPVCNSGDHRILFKKNGGQHVMCKDCKMIFVNPVMKDKDLVEYYKNNTSVQASAHEREIAFYRKIYNFGLDQIVQVKSAGDLLDIGCSSGLFLDVAMSRGFKTYGAELNLAEAAIAKSKNHTVWNVPLQEIQESRIFDVITLWDVFEHIKNGVEYLIDLRRRLVRGGVLFMQIPSADSLAARILRERCNVFDGIEHVNLYSVNTIARCFSSRL